MAKQRRWILVLAMAVTFLMGVAHGARGGSEEERIKSLYLYNFLLFVDWPEPIGRDGKFLRVCVAGDDPFFQALADLSKEPVKGKSVVIERLSSAETLDARCHALFIGKNERDRAGLFLEKVRGRPVLTLSDMEGFAELGGMVCFRRLDGREQKDALRRPFDINLKAVTEAGLVVRSRLLRLSNIVD